MKKLHTRIVSVIFSFLLIFGMLSQAVLSKGYSAAPQVTASSGQQVYTSVQKAKKLVSLQLERVTLSEALRKLSREAGMELSFSSELLPGKVITVHIQAATVYETLDKLLAGTDLEAVIPLSGDVIFLRKKETQEQDKFQETVKGRVVDAQTGDPMPGVNVIVKGTTTGTSTDSEGNYELNIPSLRDTLIFSFVGYQTREVPVNGRTNIDVALQPQAISGEELVVVGYGTQRRSSLTTSVSDISSDELEKKNVTDARQALQGIAPGITVVDRGGAPGENDIGIRIRGNTTIGGDYPLILVNGIEQDFSDLNPDNIKSITVLKDAAATAIYGSRAATGVILVTTKEPPKGKLQVEYDGSLGFENIAVRPEHLSTEEFLRGVNTAFANQPGGQPKYTEEYIQNYVENVKKGNLLKFPKANDFANVMYGPGPVQDHFLSFSGGSDQLSARLSLNLLNRDGIIPNFSYNRKEIRFDTQYDPTDFLHVDTKLTYRRRDIHQPADEGRLYFNLWHGSQFTVPQYPDGSFGLSDLNRNPLLDALKSGTQDNSADYFVANINARVDVLENLSYTVRFGGFGSLATNHQFNRKYFLRDYFSDQVIFRRPVNALNEYRNRSQRWNWRNLLNYILDIDQNNQLRFLAGYEEIRDDFNWVNAWRQEFYNNDLQALNAGSQENWSNGGGSSEERLRSAFGRVHYSYADKYIIEANARYDGSSRFFGSNNQYGFFPSVSAAWRISKESFWVPASSIVSDLKLRGSWGKTGNNTVGLYTFFENMQRGTYSFGGNLVTNYGKNSISNPDLSWETTTQTNIGIDTEFMQGLFSFSFDYYKKRTDGILLVLPIAGVVGLNAPAQNAGIVDNRGWDLSLTHRNNVTKDFNYSIKANLSNFKSEVVDLAQSGPFIGGGFFDGTLTKVGEPLNSIYGYKVLGYFRSEEEIANYPTFAGKNNTFPGDLKYVDLNDDGQINANDKTVIGNRDQHFDFGITANANYKNFDLNLFIQGVGKRDAQITGPIREGVNFKGFTTKQAGDYWTLENTDARIPRPQKFSFKNYQSSSWWVINTGYVKLKSAQLGYTIPSQTTRKVGIRSLRFYLSGTNLFTLSETLKWGIDPEAYANQQVYYPQTRTFSVGVNLKF